MPGVMLFGILLSQVLAPGASSVSDPIVSSAQLIFSWMLLPVLSVIVAGKFIARRIPFEDRTPQAFTLKIPPLPKVPAMLEMKSTNGEVVLGIGGFLVTLCFIGLFAGPQVQLIIRNGFGIPTEQYNSIAIFSSLMTVVWSLVLFLTIFIPRPQSAVAIRQDELIEQLAAKRRPVSSTPI